MSSQSQGDGHVHLSPRQEQLLKLIAEDLTSKEIGKRLKISMKTVDFHRGELKNKLGVRGTAGLVRYAIREGIIEA
jgi:DNA-binding CsgD family transcriptional regulator